MVKVFIDGEAGTTGLGIRERLQRHPFVQLLEIEPAFRKDSKARRALLHEADIAFLCLPDEAARESAALANGSAVRILDASTAHRTAQGWVYGFAELSKAQRAAITNGDRVAVPGCHASGMITLAYPLLAAGLLPKDANLCFTSVTGYSGGGKNMIAQYEAGDRPSGFASPRLYSLSQGHKHLPEVKAQCGLHKEPGFLPFVADFPRGMAVSLVLHQDQFTRRASLQDLWEIMANHYAESPLMRVWPLGSTEEEGGYLSANALSGHDGMEILLHGNESRVLLNARFDNLGKGASGAALQCMNIMLGLDETTGLVP